jgi:hypothetical protein
MEPLEVYGPPGTRLMAKNMLRAYDFDIKTRTEHRENVNKTGYKVNVREIQPGVVYRDRNVTVKAFAVHHGEVRYAYGYRFETLIGPSSSLVMPARMAPSCRTVTDAMF